MSFKSWTFDRQQTNTTDQSMIRLTSSSKDFNTFWTMRALSFIATCEGLRINSVQKNTTIPIVVYDRKKDMNQHFTHIDKFAESVLDFDHVGRLGKEKLDKILHIITENKTHFSRDLVFKTNSDLADLDDLHSWVKEIDGAIPLL